MSEYVDHWSILLDLKILLLTIWKWIQREGIDQPGYISAEEFMGNGMDIQPGKETREAR
jgi:hypothetical protein